MRNQRKDKVLKMVKLQHLRAKCSRICHRDKGFTLVEILIVVIILAIAAAIAIPRMGSAGAMQMRAAADMIAADLEYAKSMATSRQADYTVIFNTSTESYQIEDASGVINHPVKVGQFIVNFSADSRLDEVDITNVNFNSTSQVQFDRLGSPDNAGTVTLQAGGATATITVEAETGYISTSY